MNAYIAKMGKPVARKTTDRTKALGIPADRLPMYDALRQDGDSHSTAIDTIRGEVLMASLTRR